MAEVASTPDSTGGVLRQDILLTTKLHAPLVRPDLVARPRLVELVDRGLSSRLTLISAPAGSGKTTLLAEWIAYRKPSVAWLSLDKGDNDPTRFWAYVILALPYPTVTFSHSTEPVPLLGNLTNTIDERNLPTFGSRSIRGPYAFFEYTLAFSMPPRAKIMNYAPKKRNAMSFFPELK